MSSPLFYPRGLVFNNDNNNNNNNKGLPFKSPHTLFSSPTLFCVRGQLTPQKPPFGFQTSSFRFVYIMYILLRSNAQTESTWCRPLSPTKHKRPCTSAGNKSYYPPHYKCPAQAAPTQRNQPQTSDLPAS